MFLCKTLFDGTEKEYKKNNKTKRNSNRHVKNVGNQSRIFQILSSSLRWFMLSLRNAAASSSSMLLLASSTSPFIYRTFSIVLFSRLIFICFKVFFFSLWFFLCYYYYFYTIILYFCFSFDLLSAIAAFMNWILIALSCFVWNSFDIDRDPHSFLFVDWSIQSTSLGALTNGFVQTIIQL